MRRPERNARLCESLNACGRMSAQQGDEGQHWMAMAMAALLGAGSMAMAAVWLHRRLLERLVESRVRKLTSSMELVDKSRRSKLRKCGGGSRRLLPKESPAELWCLAGDSESGDRVESVVKEGQTRFCDENGGEMISNEQGQLKNNNVGADLGTERQDEHPRKKLFEKPVPEGGKVFSRPRSRSPPVADEVDPQSGTGLHGLPRVRTRLEGVNQSFGHPGSTRRTAHVGTALMRPSPPKSKGGLFDIDGSDDEDSLMSSLHEEPGGEQYLGEEPILDDSYEESMVRMEEESKVSLPISGIECTMEPDAASSRQHSIADELLGAPDQVAADILRKEPEQETFVRMRFTPNDPPTPEEEEVCLLIQECLALREKYLFCERDPPWKKGTHASCSSNLTPDPFYYEPEQKSDHVYEMQDGVVHIYANKEAKEELFPVPDATTFFTDMHRILRITGMGNFRTFCYHRLLLLEQKFSLHLMLNADRECLAQKSAPHRDFYNVRKVDTHVHHSSCMNQKHLLRFIKSKLRKEPDEVVIFRDGQYLTLKEVFESLDLTGYDLNVDLLDVHADKNTFHRFDKFNLKYNPCGQSRLREIFLKQENLIQGRFLAELTKEVFQDLTVSKYQMAEYRISVYGRKQSEWDQLASWIVNNELHTQNVVWLIQLPRLYNCYKKMGIVTSFQNILDNLFLPLFEVTVDPGSHPQLHVLLKQVVGFDMVDDESKPERRPNKHMQTPAEWDIAFNPAYSYWAYYVYANLYTLNKLRECKGLTTIKFRPHSGEAGDLDHLASTFLLAHCIAHGINLRKYPGLQYLYYLTQIGLAMSPLSNNSLFLDYHRNPFPVFFSRGLNVSLSTDDPLQIHLTKEPLVEEYSIAAQVWKLSSSDLCEIARNSVYQSGFPHSLKLHWIGNKYFKRGAPGNDIHKTNVPHMRVEFRHETWTAELQYVWLGTAKISEEIDP